MIFVKTMFTIDLLFFLIAALLSSLYIFFLSSSFIWNPKKLFNRRYCFPTMSICFSNSLPNSKYSNLLRIFLVVFFFFKMSSPVKNSYLPTSLYDKPEILGTCLSKLYLVLFCSILFLIVLTLLLNWQPFYKRFFLNLNELSDGKVELFTKNENDSLVQSL